MTTTKTKKPRLTWRKQPNEQGLAHIGQTPRGAILKVNGEDVGRVCARGGGASHHGLFKGWYWYASSDTHNIALRNTIANGTPLYADLDAAKAACEAYVRECLGLVKS